MAATQEARRVQITGKSTHIISLPKKWVEKMRIRGGDVVLLVTRGDGTLIVNPGATAPAVVAQVQIDAGTLSVSALERRLVAAYVAGWSDILVDFGRAPSPAAVQAVRTVCQGLVGPQVVEEGPTSITLRVLTDAADFAPSQGLKRLHGMARALLQRAALGMDRTTKDSAQPLEGDMAEVRKIYWLVAKQCGRLQADVMYADRLGVEPARASGFLLVARSLVDVASGSRRLASMSDALRTWPRNSELAALLDLATATLDEVVRAFLEGNADVVEHALELFAAAESEWQILSERVQTLPANGASHVSSSLALGHVRAALDSMLDIAECGIDDHYHRLRVPSAGPPWPRRTP